MDVIRRYLARIQAQLRGLTVSQKLLVLLLVVIMIGTIYLVVIGSSKPEMVVLIPQAMTSEEINRIEMELKGRYEYQISGDKVLVPAEKAYAIRGELFAKQALPKDTTAAFSKLIESNNFFAPDADRARQWNFATQETLMKMLRYFPGIEDGTVLISKGERAGIGRDAVPSSATVIVKTRGNDGLTTPQVVAIVDMVRGAVAGLRREDVHVSDGTRTYHAPSQDTQMSSTALEAKKQIEDALTAKLYTMFGHIPQVKIAVNAVPDFSLRETVDQKYDPKIIKAPEKESNKESTSNEGNSGSGEPGVKSNVGGVTADNGNGGHHTSTTTSDSTTSNVIKIGDTKTKTILPAGTELKDLTASISIPRSYFVAIYHRLRPEEKGDPKDDDLRDAVINKENTRFRTMAKNVIGAKTDDQVNVDWFDDTIAVRTGDGSSGAGMGAGSVANVFNQYGKQGVLALVALGALGMMLMMVRKAVPGGGDGDVDASVFFGSGGGKRRRGETNALDVEEEMIGEAGAGEAVLTGIELDDETLQSRKMVDEVSTMIKENPENAASLVKRWMTKNG